jgi:phosphatidylserine/phosphatidylglycerophosphate/cardiolipin synthase-like enzyme
VIRVASDYPNKWFLKFSSVRYNLKGGDGRPWGDGTSIAARENKNLNPWYEGCKVTTMIGGFEAMSSMRNDLEDAIKSANQSLSPKGERGYVYIADWRLNALRDLSEGTDPWLDPLDPPPDPSASNANDQTAIGLILRLMQAGIKIRIMIWLTLPGFKTEWLGGFKPHILDHIYFAKVVENESNRLSSPDKDPLGVVALDVRVPNTKEPSASHHQKMMVIRVGDINTAYCGGVDLAFTRRDAPCDSPASTPASPRFLCGDWQSGEKIPDKKFYKGYPRQGGVKYSSINATSPPKKTQGTDLPGHIYGIGTDKGNRQIWHDQHLRLEGPIVAAVEETFRERWKDSGDPIALPKDPGKWKVGSVLVSSKALDQGKIRTLDVPLDIQGPAGSSLVQLWRTMPIRKREDSPFKRGEYTIIAGVANACQQASKLIWIFDQYFWSLPMARLLNWQLDQNPDLHVIVILPPFSDGERMSIPGLEFDSMSQVRTHKARKVALDALVASGKENRVGVYNLWNKSRNDGIYCHAKAHTYDGNLLVCGSANVNRRSFTCDTEIACAVLNSSVVLDHQERLWHLLFPDTPWIGDSGSDFSWDDKNAGKTFFDKFNEASINSKSFLIEDPWRKKDKPKLPNNVERDQDPFLDFGSFSFDYFYNNVLDPVIPGLENIERPVLSRGTSREPRLDDIVARLEMPFKDRDGNMVWPRGRYERREI